VSPLRCTCTCAVSPRMFACQDHSASALTTCAFLRRAIILFVAFVLDAAFSLSLCGFLIMHGRMVAQVLLLFIPFPNK